ncbi:MAG: lytic transglycosylase domain-containing protein [Acidobacteriota bacterium]
MKRAALLLALLFFALPSFGMELVIFRSRKALVVEHYREERGEALMVLPGGGTFGCPIRQIARHVPGYVPPPSLPDPETALPKDLPYRKLIGKYCQKYQMDCRLVSALIRVESNFNPKAVSPKGAQGLMQLMPSVQKDEGVSDPFDPAQNIRAGIHYLKRLLKTFQGDLRLTLAAYNAGLTRVQASGDVPDIPETQHYVARILKLYPTL